jgi:hypothetical protein
MGAKVHKIFEILVKNAVVHNICKHSLGFSFSWIGKHIDTYRMYYKDTVDGKGWKHYFTLQMNYRYTYYSKNKISLYFSIHSGITLCMRDKDILPKETIHHFLGSTSNVTQYFAPAAHFNAFGIAIGEKYIFYMELGFGTQGIFKTGFKYKYS